MDVAKHEPAIGQQAPGAPGHVHEHSGHEASEGDMLQRLALEKEHIKVGGGGWRGGEVGAWSVSHREGGGGRGA